MPDRSNGVCKLWILDTRTSAFDSIKGNSDLLKYRLWQML